MINKTLYKVKIRHSTCNRNFQCRSNNAEATTDADARAMFCEATVQLRAVVEVNKPKSTGMPG